MAGEAKVVKLCSISQVLPACDTTDPNNPVAIKEVIVIDSNGEMVAHDSTAYSAAGTGFVGDGSGQIRSYLTDLDGNPIVRPASWSNDCSVSSNVDIELGCIVDTADETIDPIPARVQFDVAPDGTATPTYFSLIDGTQITLTATQVFQEGCDRFDTEERAFCVRDAAGAVVAQVTRVRVYDTQDTDTPLAPISETLIDDITGLEYTLAAGESLGSCDVFAPILVQGCLIDDVAVPPTRRQAYQLTPVINGAPDFTVASYVAPADGAAITVGGDESFAFGECGTPCITC